MSRQLCIVMHDVAPETWPNCERLLAMIESLGAAPVTLLVVPVFHQRLRIDEAPEFLRAMQLRVARGDEIALHGWFHRDDAPAPRSPLAWLRRRVLTASEGEFATLPVDVAEARLRDGLDLFAELGWYAEGFVPPAWLASSGTHEALRRIGMRWTSTHTALIDVKNANTLAAPCLTASPRSAWRRAASIVWLRAGAKLVSRAQIVRVGLHPADADHPHLVACWRHVIGELLARRQPITKSEAIKSQAVQVVGTSPLRAESHVEPRHAREDATARGDRVSRDSRALHQARVP